MKATNYFKTCCKLIDTVNKNYSHIAELEELRRLFDAASDGTYWANDVGIEYDLLTKIVWETYWNHYKRTPEEERSKWDIEYILEKLKVTDELSEIIPMVDLDKYPEVNVNKYIK